MKKPDLTPFFQGRELNAYTFFGAHPDKNGTEFKVYAPNAKEIAVIGDFNSWDGKADPMTKDDNGIWSAVVKGAKPGQAYLPHYAGWRRGRQQDRPIRIPG